MAGLDPTLTKKEFKNWLKGALALLFTKDALTDFVSAEVDRHHQRLLQLVPAANMHNTCNCTINSLPQCTRSRNHNHIVPVPKQLCSRGVCNSLMDGICRDHRFRGPSWKNTDPQKWCTNAFEIAKCFFPPDGYSHTTSLLETDFNGVVSVIINNLSFSSKIQDNLATKPNVCTKARIFGRVIRHSANHLISDQDLMKYIDDLITLLSDPTYLAADVKANDAVGKLKQLKTNTLTIHADDITNVLSESIKTTFDDQKKRILLDIQEHFRKHENDSVEVIDRKIQESVDKQLAEIKAQTDRGKGELNAEKEKGKSELKLQIKTGKDELQAQLEQGKGELNSKVEKGKIELSDQTEQGKDELNSKVEKGKVELSAQTEQGKGELNSKVEKGKGELSAQTEQGKYELNSKVEKGKVELSAKTEQGLDELNAQIRQGADELKVQTLDGKDELSSHIAKGKTEVEAKTNQGKEEIETRGKQVLEEINRSAVLKTANNDDSLLQDLKEDIITYYREHESVIPASPLVDEHNVPIVDLYVLPPMWAYKNSYYEPSKNTQKGDEKSGNDGQDKQEITISGLFLSGDVRHRKIYITANAGFGKTSLSQKLTMTWCQSHLPLTSLTENYKGDELAAMKHFDLLFLLYLRDYQSEPKCNLDQSEPKCNLDDLIMKMVSANVSRKSQYTSEFIERILHEKKCLVILDGLDEWAHPGQCKKKPEVPHNKHPHTCTVLTTTRDWKIGTIGLSENHIDRRVEISMLDDETRKQLEKNAIGILNKRNLNLARKNIADFDEAVASVQIGNIIYNPYILLQLMCVFFNDLPIGKSKCEIYSNITEFTLKRGLNKRSLPDVQTNDNAQVPNCMNENETCKRYFILLMKLGKLAFYTLFSENKESSLLFDRRIVARYMTEQEIEFCLKVGLLCQTKDSSIIAEKRYHVFFQHKSVQEFFSAIYITSEWQNESVKSTILKVCSSLSGILEMSNVFVFVCGINPEVYTCISGELQTIVDLDDVTRRYRTDMHSDNDARKTMKSYQSMQVQCLQESVRNGNDSCSIHLHDYILTEEDLTTLKTIINFNKCNVKSLQLSYSDKTTAFMQCLDPVVFTSLETLSVADYDKEPVCLADILTESARTLKCLLGLSSLSAISIPAPTGLTCLQSLYLADVEMTHSNLKCLYASITQTTTLTQLILLNIHCSDHTGQYRDCDVTLDLHRLNELKILDLVFVSCIELHVNTSCLKKLLFKPPPWVEKMTARASATLWQDLRAAPVLSSLTLVRMTSCQEMIQTIPTLTQLQHLQLVGINMDIIPRVSPDMIQLERVKLDRVTMSSAAWLELFVSVGQLPRSITVELSCITMTYQEWRELLLSVGQLQHPVTVKLSLCYGPSREEWQAIVNVIKTTPTLSLLPDLSISDWGSASLTLKNKTV